MPGCTRSSSSGRQQAAGVGAVSAPKKRGGKRAAGGAHPRPGREAVAGAEPGRLHRLDAAAQPLPQGLFGCSTHGFGVAEGIELARALGTLPPVCVVYAVEGERFDTGAPMSEAVTRALPALGEEILKEIERNIRIEKQNA